MLEVLQELLGEIENIEFPVQGLGCGLEDVNITEGWQG